MEDAENHSPDSAALNRTPRLQSLNVILRCLQQRAGSRTMVVTAERKEEGFRMLSENIRAIRKSKGLSQEELAIKLNVVRQSSCYQDKRKNCNRFPR